MAALLRLRYYFAKTRECKRFQQKDEQRFNEVFHVIFTNLKVAFREKYTVSEYREIAKKLVDARHSIGIDMRYLLDPTVNVGRINFLCISYCMGHKTKTGWLYKRVATHLQNKIEHPNKAWSSFFKFYKLFPLQHKQRLDRALEKKNGALVCCFHLGQYRLLPDMLSSMGYKVKMLVDQKVYDEQFKEIQEIRNGKTDYLTAYNQMEFLIAEDPNIATKILSSLKNNEIVLFYLDGNTGSGTQTQKAEIQPFFHQKLYTRKGAIFLAIMNGSPIIPFVSLWKSTTTASMEFYDEWVYDSAKKFPHYAAEITQNLYQFFLKFIEKEPWQWDQWVDCHRFWVPVTNTASDFSEEDFKQEVEQVAYYLDTEEDKKIELNHFSCGYFLLRKGLVLVDINSGKLFHGNPFFQTLLPIIDEKPKQLKEIKHLFKEYTNTDIAEHIARLKILNYIALS